MLNTSSFASAISSALGNGKQVLFKCGDTFTGGPCTTEIGEAVRMGRLLRRSLWHMERESSTATSSRRTS